MTKLLVLTDSHRAWRKLKAALDKHPEADRILHLGDHDSDMDDFPDAAARLVSVAGNCDLFSMQPGTRFIQVEGVKILMTHGDAFGVKRGPEGLAARACREGCALALFGHTHEKCDTVLNGVRLINPGAVKDGRYAVVAIDGTAIQAEYFETEL